MIILLLRSSSLLLPLLARSPFIQGAPLVLSALWVDNSLWEACAWTTPRGRLWTVVDGQVVDVIIIIATTNTIISIKVIINMVDK